MKKLVAGVAAAAALSLTFAGAAEADYGTPQPTSHVKHNVLKIVHHKGKLSKKRAAQLKRKVRAAKAAGAISPKTAKLLIKKINKDTKKHH